VYILYSTKNDCKENNSTVSHTVHHYETRLHFPLVYNSVISVHEVKSLACSTLSFSLREARICKDLLIQLHLPLHSIRRNKEICSAYGCKVGADSMSSANGANIGRDAYFCYQNASVGVDSAECWISLRYCVACSPTDVRTGCVTAFCASFEDRNLNFFKSGMTCSASCAS